MKYNIMKITWKYLQNFHFNPPSCILPRTKKIQEDYDNHKNKLKKANITIDKYILKTILKNNLKYKITKNRFPYDLDENIKHYLLWISPDIQISQIKVINIIKKYFPNNQLVCYQNEMFAKSVKTIDHYHIFIKF